jgi:hypothetical protein
LTRLKQPRLDDHRHARRIGLRFDQLRLQFRDLTLHAFEFARAHTLVVGLKLEGRQKLLKQKAMLIQANPLPILPSALIRTRKLDLLTDLVRMRSQNNGVRLVIDPSDRLDKQHLARINALPSDRILRTPILTSGKRLEPLDALSILKRLELLHLESLGSLRSGWIGCSKFSGICLNALKDSAASCAVRPGRRDVPAGSRDSEPHENNPRCCRARESPAAVDQRFPAPHPISPVQAVEGRPAD